ncbi:hypothetical protein FIE12Z_12583 [Fusarium flagelliforme]|uniref:Uncharacterized protein n=1 Tax=Fusarium flagelliforme TaxID=2675880 RepID=A0A395M5L9_9HYPO|nr:hypothetical protein FIE12Z_12583 [Fusarium flagelliforme]
MSDIIEKTIQFTYRPKRGTKSEPGGRKNPANAYLYRHWGYPIYRTYYGPGSDESWNELLHSLKQQTRLGLGAFEEEDQEDVQKLKDLFHLNSYEDPTTLEGLDVKGLRQFCNYYQFGISTAFADCLFHFVLMADKSVLEDIKKGTFVVKAVSLLWDGHPGWGFNTESALHFFGPEEDLDTYIWAGDLANEETGRCSEICGLRCHYGRENMYVMF